MLVTTKPNVTPEVRKTQAETMAHEAQARSLKWHWVTHVVSILTLLATAAVYSPRINPRLKRRTGPTPRATRPTPFPCSFFLRYKFARR